MTEAMKFHDAPCTLGVPFTPNLPLPPSSPLQTQVTLVELLLAKCEWELDYQHLVTCSLHSKLTWHFRFKRRRFLISVLHPVLL